MFVLLCDKCTSYFVLVILCALAVSSQNASISIPLNKTLTPLNKELYGDFISLNHSSTTQVNFEAVNKNISFIIFQVHSHVLNVTLYNNTLQKGSYITGTNIGLYSSAKKLDTFFVYNPSTTDDIRLYVSVQGYKAGDPIPGGCNMEFPIATSPYLLTTYNKEFIYVDGASAKDPADKNCNAVKDLKVAFYRLYLPERDFSADAYFEGLTNMMTLENIMEFGEVVPETGVMWTMRRMLAAYPGTGSVYVAVASSASGYGVYVPAYTYACQPQDEDDGCVLLDDVFSQLLCASLLFVGAFVCYFGHKFFKTEMFLIGLATGALVTYILIANIADLDRPALVAASILSGTFFGAIWLIFWWFYGIPVFAVLLSTMNLGFLVASIVYFSSPGGIDILEQDFNFWTFFIFIMTLTSVTLISITFLSNLLCCCILGAYAIIYPVDYYVGSNLKYIVINAVRRAIVPKFNYAVVSPPIQLNDVVLIVLWMGLALTGFLFQHYHNRGRPPFPPPPRSITPRLEGPTFYGTQTGAYQVPVSPSVINATAPPLHQQSHTERTPLLA